jgi:hypothetical protein
MKAPVLYFCLSFASLTGALYYAKTPALALCGILFALVFGSAGLVETFHHIRAMNDKHVKAASQAVAAGDVYRNESVRAVFAEAKTLTPEQMILLGKFNAVIDVTANIGPTAEPDYHLCIGDARIEWDVVEDFARRSQGEGLAPIGLYSEGSKERSGYEMIHNFLLANGHARRVGGPVGDVWTNRNRGLLAIGITPKVED